MRNVRPLHLCPATGTRFNRTPGTHAAKAEMNFALPSPAPSPAHKRFSRPLWLSAFGWFVACVGSVTLAAASMPAVGWASNAVNPTSVTHRGPAVLADTMPEPRVAEGITARSTRCNTCGVVEVVRTREAAGTALAGYELTVRFRDGSRRLSSHADGAGWRAGDSIMLIGGTRLADRI